LTSEALRLIYEQTVGEVVVLEIGCKKRATIMKKEPS